MTPDRSTISITILICDDDEDVLRSYQLGANSFITKPDTFSGLVDAMTVIGRYWFEIVELPPVPG